MQIIGLCVLVVVVAYGFTERDMTQISVFDSHALIVVLFVFACLGTSLFGTLKPGRAIGDQATFSSFGRSLLLLLRI